MTKCTHTGRPAPRYGCGCFVCTAARRKQGYSVPAPMGDGYEPPAPAPAYEPPAPSYDSGGGGDFGGGGASGEF